MVGSIGDGLRDARRAANLSQEDLAKHLGLTRRTVGEWERTSKIPAIYMDRLTEILGREVVGDDTPAPAPIAFTFEGTTITVHPNPAYTPDQVRRAAREIFDASMERLARLDQEE